jgi:hypothetical protein
MPKNPFKGKEILELLEKLCTQYQEWFKANGFEDEDQLLLVILDVIESYSLTSSKPLTIHEVLGSIGGTSKTIILNDLKSIEYYDAARYCQRYYASLAAECINTLKELSGKILDSKDCTIH